MDLKDLEYTLAIAKYRSISKAAKELFLSQPYLSSKLKSLEKELGIQIFRRTSTGIIPTASGEELLNSAAKIHSEVEYIRRLKARSSCRLDIVSYYRPFFFNCFLRFQGNFPVEGSESFKEQRDAELHSEQYQLWEQELLSHLPQDRSLRILDVGCGCGFFTLMLAEHGHRVTGIDLTGSMIRKGRELAQEYGVAADLRVMDAEHPDFSDDTFLFIPISLLAISSPFSSGRYLRYSIY